MKNDTRLTDAEEKEIILQVIVDFGKEGLRDLSPGELLVIAARFRDAASAKTARFMQADLDAAKTTLAETTRDWHDEMTQGKATRLLAKGLAEALRPFVRRGRRDRPGNVAVRQEILSGVAALAAYQKATEK